MSEKIRLSNGEVLEISSCTVSGEKMKVSFANIGLEELRPKLDNKFNLVTIEVLNEADVLGTIYNNYKKVDEYRIVPDAAGEYIEVTLSRPNEIEERLESIESAIETLILSELGVI